MAGGQPSEDTSEGLQAKGELALGTTQWLGPLPLLGGTVQPRDCLCGRS